MPRFDFLRKLLIILFLTCAPQIVRAESVPEMQEMVEQKPPMPSFQALFAKSMILVFFLLALATGGLILLKKTQNRFLKSQNESALMVLEKRALSQKTQLFLISVRGKEMLLIESGHTVTISPIDSTTPQEVHT